MSAAKIENDDHTHDALRGHGDNQDDERRHLTDSKDRDRRVIPRLGHAEIRQSMRFSGHLCTFAVVSIIAYIGGMIARHVHDSTLELNKTLFFGVVLAFIAGGIHYLGSGIRSYVQNESEQRLIAVSERLSKVLFLFLVTGMILGIANVITWF